MRLHLGFHFRSAFFYFLTFCLIATTRANLSDEQKRALFLKAKQNEEAAPSPSPSTSPAHHKKKKHSSISSIKKSSTPHKHHDPSSIAGNTSTSATSTTTDRSSTSAQKYSSTTDHTSSLSHDKIIPIESSDHETTTPTITVEKSGVLPDEGLEPPPTPEKKHGWGWIFGGSPGYHYLSWSVRRAIDRAPVRHGRWKYIVVHNSGTRAGNARSFDIYHRRVRKMVNGLAYHFVIGNGVSSGNGEIEIGHRWTAQLQGGHVASDYLNDISIGICLVGDYNRDLPTKAQIGALNELIIYLRQRVGRTQGRQAIVKAHKEINPRPTDCPGRRFPYSWLHGHFGY